MERENDSAELTGRREQNKRDKRRLLIRVSEQLFIEKGVEQTTIADIISRSGLARGTFYNYFQKKEDVWRYLVMKVLQKSNELMSTGAGNVASREEFMYMSFLSFLKVVMTSETTTALIVRNQVGLRAALFSGDDALTVTGIIEQNLRSGGYFDHLDDQRMKFLVFSVIGASLEIVVQTYIQKIPATPESLAGFLTTLFLNGIGGDGK